MSSRVSQTNAVIDAALERAPEGPGWTRDIPAGFLSRTLPYRMRDGEICTDGKLLVNPAKESLRGRGAPLFDVHGTLAGLEIGLSLKISHESRPPRNSSIAGSKAEHLFGLILAARDHVLLPVLCYWQDAAGNWSRCCFDLGAVLRESDVQLTSGWADPNGRGNPLENDHAHAQRSKLANCLGYEPAAVARAGAIAVSPLARESGGKWRFYMNAKINHAAAGLHWTPCEGPDLPESYAQLCEWMGMDDEVIG